MASNKFAKSLVACNIYISAGGMPHHRGILESLLLEAQERCDTVVRPPSANLEYPGSTIPSLYNAAVVHVFSDVVYGRSSFHLVGVAPTVVSVAAQMAISVVTTLRRMENRYRRVTKEKVLHPCVGLVDHIAVMPLVGVDKLDQSNFPNTASGWAAREIGKAMGKIDVQVFNYGTAHPEGTPLATIRRTRTIFFQSGGCVAEQNEGVKEGESKQHEVAVVGAPATFVENYNVRLCAACDKQMARSLTKAIRERDGGLVGVEALTLPYSEGRWEVACNLLRPEKSSAEDIDKIVDNWIREQGSREHLIEKCYRVGTTAQQCLAELNHSSTLQREMHNREILSRLHDFFKHT